MTEDKWEEEVCKVCGGQVGYDEAHYCDKCDAALCPECVCNCEELIPEEQQSKEQNDERSVATDA